MEQNTVQELPLPALPAILSNANLQKIYANGFIGGRTQTDIFAISLINGVPQIILNMSFSTAKNLRDLLVQTISEVESKLEQEIKSIPAVPVIN